MAEFHVSGLEELMLSLREIAELPPEVQDEILNAQADALVPEIQERGRGYGVEDSGKEDPGKMLKSIKKGKVRASKNGKKSIHVYCAGSRKRGGKRISNGEIAFLNNFGTRHQKARPFWSDAVVTSEKTVTAAGQAAYDKYLTSKNL